MDSLSLQVKAQVQANLDAASSSVKATIYDKTGVDVNNQRVAQGAQSAMALFQGGYNPNSPSDNANLVHAIAGGCCLIPGGAVFGAYVEALWQVGGVIACPVTDAFAAIGLGTRCDAPRCSSGGTNTAQNILASNTNKLWPPSASAAGSFANAAMPALANYAAQNLNCKGGVPPGIVIDALVAIWNKTHSGDLVPIMVPPLNTFAGGGSSIIIDAWQNLGGWVATNGMDPYVYYAFNPTGIIQSQDSQANATPVPSANASDDTWQPWSVAPAILPVIPARVVYINVGLIVRPTDVTASPDAAPGAGKPTVVGHASAIAAGGLVGGLAYAWVTGKAVDKVFGGAWDIFSGWVKGGLGAVEGGVRVATHAGEDLGRRRRRHAASRR